MNPEANSLGTIVMAVGALGTAAYGVVDSAKAIAGGPSNFGLVYIRRTMSLLVPKSDDATAPGVALSQASILITLRANYLNGMPAPDQKAIAKSLVKLRLNASNAARLAAVTGVDGGILGDVATKIYTGESLTPQETDVYGRFDLVLATLIDQAYQRADQKYRNCAKLLAVFVAMVIAGFAQQTLQVKTLSLQSALILGALAVPFAPIAKDLSTAIAAGAKVAQAWGKRKV